MREAERREEAATIYARSVLSEQEKLKSRLVKLDTSYVSEMEGRVKSGMEAAVAKLAKAREENNLQAEVAASAEISRLGYEEARLADMKTKASAKAEEPAPQEEQFQVPQQPRRVDPKAQEWADKNTWFNQDRIMTEGAKVIHRQMTEEEGYDPISHPEEYYMEIDRRIALEFPHKFVKNKEETTNKPTQTVASATRSSKTGRKTQRLTPSEVAIAKKLGVSLDEYAKQKRLMNTEGA
jgi:phage I-like protein